MLVWIAVIIAICLWVVEKGRSIKKKDHEK
jgi:hypothetical protein